MKKPPICQAGSAETFLGYAATGRERYKGKPSKAFCQYYVDRSRVNARSLSPSKLLTLSALPKPVHLRLEYGAVGAEQVTSNNHRGSLF